MKNKEIISRLKDMSELAWASYGYFHLANPNYKPHKSDKDGKRLAEFRKTKKEEEKHITDQELQNIYPTHADILNINYKYFKDKNGKPKDSWYHKHSRWRLRPHSS